LFKENSKFSHLVSEKLEANSIEQYQNEERSVLVKRMVGSEKRLTDLLKAMKSMELSSPEKLAQLKKEIYEFTRDINFKKAASMGEVVESALNFMKRNYKIHNEGN
jgi:hypothetical protein